MHYRAALLVCLFAISPAFCQDPTDSIRTDDLIKKEGFISSLKKLKDGKIEMKFQEDGKEESETFTVDWRTMVYKLTARNRKLFKERDKMPDIASDASKLHRRQNELPEKERKLLASMWATVHVHPGSISGHVSRSRTGIVSGHIDSVHPGSVTVHTGYSRAAADKLIEAQEAFKREEEERRSTYGSPVRLVAGMTAYVVAAKSTDRTYAVLVTGKLEPPKKDTELKSPGEQRESQANAKLSLAKGLLEDAQAAKGKEQKRLLATARARLEEIIKNYPGTPAAEEARELLKQE
jgi:hypothetical protein